MFLSFFLIMLIVCFPFFLTGEFIQKFLNIKYFQRQQQYRHFHSDYLWAISVIFIFKEFLNPLFSQISPKFLKNINVNADLAQFY